MSPVKKEERLVRYERIENLMLMAVLSEEPYRSQAIAELKKRRLLTHPESFIDSFMTNLGGVC
jgi:predicted glycosyltransferase